MEDISIEQRKTFLKREKGLELQAIYNSLLTIRNNKVEPYLIIF